MAELDKVEKWQKALERWDEWQASIKRAQLLYRDCDIAQLASKAIFKVEIINNPSGLPFRVETNAEEDKLSEIFTEIEDEIDNLMPKMGIDPMSFQYNLFQNQWIKATFPELPNRFVAEHDTDESMETPWLQYTVKRKQKTADGKPVIINRLCWYHGQVESENILRTLAYIWRKDADEVKKIALGRRRNSKEYKEYPEGIVCHILRRYYKSKKLNPNEIVKLIAEMFGWATYPEKTYPHRVRCSELERILRQSRRFIK